jgi:arylsulfatase A-like enzyme
MTLSRRHFFFGSLALPALAAKKPAGEQPNILLILVDGLPSWVLGCYGNREILTPNIDRLSQTGMRFLNHAVCAPVAVDNRAILLSGRTSLQLEKKGSGADGEAALARILAGEGYSVQTADASAPVVFSSGTKPFFLMVSYRFQAPYEGVAQKYQEMYAKAKLDTFDREPVAKTASRDKEMLTGILANQRKAAAAVSALDDEIGALWSKLRDRKLQDTTLVIFTATCGSLLGRHGLWGSGDGSDPVNMFEEVVAPPLLWSWQGHIPAQATRPELVSNYDLVPTICDLTGADLPDGNLCGRSYLPLATGKPLPKKQPWRTVVFGSFKSTEMAHGDRYKMVQRDGGKGPGELYDLRMDPRERVNQYGNPQFLTVRTGLTAELAKWKQRYSA